MHAPSAKRCYVVLDETGTFERNDRSAIAGFYTWEPPSEAEFEALWQCVLERPRGNQQIHCNEHARDARKLSRWVERAGAWLARQGWTPFAFEHSTRETIVDNKTTYVNVLADGINRLMRRLTAQRRDKLTVDILAARRTVPQKGRLAPIEPNEYKERIRERLALERTRSLRYRSELCWEYTLRYDVATTHAGLMIADLVCYVRRQLFLPLRDNYFYPPATTIRTHLGVR